MQTANVNPPITVTGRHVSITEAMRAYATKKIEGLHLDYPRIVEAKVILDVPGPHRQYAEIILFCANHITIEADSEHGDIYTAIDDTISKIARRMRKYKTRLLAKKQRPRKHQSIRHLEEQVFAAASLDYEAVDQHIEPVVIHKENYRIRPLYPDEAMADLELSDRSFVAFEHAESGKLCILYRRRDGDYGVIEPNVVVAHDDGAPSANGG